MCAIWYGSVEWKESDGHASWRVEGCELLFWWVSKSWGEGKKNPENALPGVRTEPRMPASWTSVFITYCMYSVRIVVRDSLMFG